MVRGVSYVVELATAWLVPTLAVSACYSPYSVAANNDQPGRRYIPFSILLLDNEGIQ